MKRFYVIFIVLAASCFPAAAQDMPLQAGLDSVLNISANPPFNGIVLVSQKGRTVYQRMQGFSNLEERISFRTNDQFVIGSISKQITAVLVLQEYERGHLQLHVPIRQYLPTLAQPWADTVTVHHLLTHMHGITELDKPPGFPAGTQYAYSQIGFDLLAQIAANTAGIPFEQQAATLFKKCHMKRTVHPALYAGVSLAVNYSDDDNGILARETMHTEYAAAGGFISTADDLVRWNENLHGGKLLKPATYALMISPQPGAVRQHPLFGVTEYGYGITVDTRDNLVQLGQTGFAPGFVSLNFYFPETKTSVVVLSNTARNLFDFKKTFNNHTAILDTVRGVIRPVRKAGKTMVNGG